MKTNKTNSNTSFLHKHIPIFNWLPKYNKKWLGKDIIAGLSVWALMVPQSLGYASISGVPVQYGLYAAAIGLIAYAIFASSRHVTTGPSSTIAAVSGAAVLSAGVTGTPEAVTLVAAITFVTGLMYIVMAIFKMGWVSNFLAASVLTGFIFGIGIDVIIGQLGKITGYSVSGENAWYKLASWVSNLSSTNIATLMVGIGTIILLFLMYKFTPKIPGALVALILGIVVSTYLGLSNEGVKIVGEVPTGLPVLVFPDFNFIMNNLTVIISSSVAVLMIALSESIATSRLYATKHHYQIDINQEMLAQGTANMSAGLFQGISVAGSLSKSSLNDSSGAKSQMSSLAQSVFIIITLLFLAPLFTNLPDAVLGAIVIVAVYFGLLNVKEMKRIYQLNRTEFWISIFALLGVVTFGTLQGVIIGLTLSILVLIWRSSIPAMPVLGKVEELGVYKNIENYPNAKTIAGVIILRFDTALFFANESALSNRVQEVVSQNNGTVKVLLLDLQNVNYIDLEGSDVIAEVKSNLDSKNISLRIVNSHDKVKKYLTDTGAVKIIGKNNFYSDMKQAETKISKH